MSKLAQYINQHIVGTVFDTPTVRSHYATDRSILQIIPRLVAFPKNTTDLRKLVRFSNQLAAKGYELPVTVRGTGLDQTGAAIGQGLIISTACLNQIEEIDLRGRLVRVQPGVTLGSLNQALSLHGLWLPIAADPQATIGGLIANAPRDDFSSRYGGISASVERVELVLADGAAIEVSPYSRHAVRRLLQSNTSEAKLYRRLEQLLNRHADLIMNAHPRRPSLAGYPYLNRVRTKHQWNLLPLVFGSQGTLGIISDIILHVELLPPPTRRLIATFRDTAAALHFLRQVTPLAPRTIKLYDLRIAEVAAAQGVRPEFLGRKIPQGWLVELSFDDRPFRTARKLHRSLDLLPASAHPLVETDDNATSFAELDSMLLTYLNTGDHSPIVPDVYIPPENLPDFLAGLSLLEQTLEIPLPLYGSYLTANYQVRPAFSYSDLAGRQAATNFLRQYLRLVQDCGGSVTGGSPEGRLKVNPDASDASLPTDAAVKTAFDPYNILNPEVKLGAELSQPLRHLRTADRPGIVTP